MLVCPWAFSCNFLWRATLLASVNAVLPGAPLLSGAQRVLVIAIGVVIALEQLGLATSVILTAFTITFGALMLGLAIAFGLGGQAAAKILLEEQFRAKNEPIPTPLRIFGWTANNCQAPTPKRSLVSSLGVGNWALGVDTRSLIGL